jgi:hypothetical protein
MQLGSSNWYLGMAMPELMTSSCHHVSAAMALLATVANLHECRWQGYAVSLLADEGNKGKQLPGSMHAVLKSRLSTMLLHV